MAGAPRGEGREVRVKWAARAVRRCGPQWPSARPARRSAASSRPTPPPPPPLPRPSPVLPRAPSGSSAGRDPLCAGPAAPPARGDACWAVAAAATRPGPRPPERRRAAPPHCARAQRGLPGPEEARTLTPSLTRSAARGGGGGGRTGRPWALLQPDRSFLGDRRRAIAPGYVTDRLSRRCAATKAPRRRLGAPLADSRRRRLGALLGRKAVPM